jgi:translocation and assembly module TamA
MRVSGWSKAGFCGLMLAAVSAFAADPQPYRVELTGTGNGDIDATLKATSDLQALRSSAPVSPFGLIARARSDVDRLTTALESYGYYQSTIAVRINGILLSDPGLGDALSALPKGDTAHVAINFKLGTLYTLRNIDIEGAIPDGINAQEVLGLRTGEPAVAARVLQGGARLLNMLQEHGYAFAKVDAPVAYEAADAPALDLTFMVVAGEKARIGQIRFEGLKHVHESLVRKRILLNTGEPFRPSIVDRARQDLLALNVFNQVSVQVGTETDTTGGVPLTFRMRERPGHAVSVTAAYSSDLGGSGGATWTDRNVFGNAEQLTLSANIINLGGADTNGTGYDTGAKYLIPDFLRRDQSLVLAINAVKQELQAYDQTSRTASATLVRKLSSVWSVSAGVLAADDHVVQPPQAVGSAALGNLVQPQIKNYILLALPLTVSYDSTHLASPLEDPTHGYRGALSLTPTVAIGHPSSTFLITQLKAAAFFDLDKIFGEAPGRTVLAARTIVGQALGAGELSLPPDQRFYGGGSATIRGYGYQKVGPLFGDDTNFPIGGTAITAAGVEIRQRFLANFGAAAFVDAGQVSAKLKFLPDELRIGVGAGIRYYTPIGPIRFDVAIPTKRDHNDDSFEIYIGLGQTF